MAATPPSDPTSSAAPGTAAARPSAPTVEGLVATFSPGTLAEMYLAQRRLREEHSVFTERRQMGMEARLACQPRDANPWPDDVFGGGWERGWCEMDNLLRAQRLDAAETALKRLADAAKPVREMLDDALVGEAGPLLVELRAALDAVSAHFEDAQICAVVPTPSNG